MTQQKCKIKGGTRDWRGIHINSELFLFLFFECSVQKKKKNHLPCVVGPASLSFFACWEIFRRGEVLKKYRILELVGTGVKWKYLWCFHLLLKLHIWRYFNFQKTWKKETRTTWKCALFWTPDMRLMTFSGNFIIRVCGNEFSQECSGHCVKCEVWGKV